MKRIYAFNISLLLLLAATGCQKEDRPAMPDFPRDQENPGGVLNFFTAFENTEVDSIKANFGTAVNASYEEGVSGLAYKGSESSYIQYASANDFARVTSFTVAFWMKKSPQPAGAGAEFVFALPTTTDIWHMSELFLLIEDAGQSTPELAAFKLMIQDQWFEFTGDRRLKNVLDNQWHHLAFTYDESTSKITAYVDGAMVTGLPAGFEDVKKNGSPRGPLSFTNTSGFIIGGPSKIVLGKAGEPWMVEYTGALDQFRLYSKALAAAEINALYTARR